MGVYAGNDHQVESEEKGTQELACSRREKKKKKGKKNGMHLMGERRGGEKKALPGLYIYIRPVHPPVAAQDSPPLILKPEWSSPALSVHANQLIRDA